MGHGRNRGLGREFVEETILKFPKLGNHTIARICYKQSPELFTNQEQARGLARMLRGSNGKKDRYLANPDCARIPEGKTHFKDWGPVQIDGPLKALVLQDTHVPYHDPIAVRSTIDHGKSQGCNMVVLNGDIADCFAVSFWEKDPRQRDFASEIDIVKHFLDALRSHFPKARFIYKLGNHEERFIRYMMVKAPELLGIPEFDFTNLYDLHDMQVVQDKRPIRLGKLNVLHGHEYRFAISNPVNPARGLFLRTRAHSLCGHFHQKSEHNARSVEQKGIACWSTGCLCDLHPDYAPFNEWSHGFAIVEVDKDGEFEVRNHYIAHGKVF